MSDTTSAYRIKVLLDGLETSFEAWNDGEAWNGFEMPFFEEEQLRRLQTELAPNLLDRSLSWSESMILGLAAESRTPPPVDACSGHAMLTKGRVTLNTAC